MISWLSLMTGGSVVNNALGKTKPILTQDQTTPHTAVPTNAKSYKVISLAKQLSLQLIQPIISVPR